MILRQSDIQERIVSNIERDERGCWNWQGSLLSTGYGQITLRDERIYSTHRASWYAFRDMPPAGMWVLHKCDNRRCCNPDHLFLGTPAENTQDMVRKGRHISPMKRRQHCPRGHPYDSRNINGARICKRCNVAATQRCTEKKREIYQ